MWTKARGTIHMTKLRPIPLAIQRTAIDTPSFRLQPESLSEHVEVNAIYSAIVVIIVWI